MARYPEGTAKGKGESANIKTHWRNKSWLFSNGLRFMTARMLHTSIPVRPVDSVFSLKSADNVHDNPKAYDSKQAFFVLVF